MALSDSSVIDRLTELYEDSWNNLYSPLTLENTVIADHLTDELRAEIEDLKQREHANEERIGAVDKQTKYKLLNIESQIEDVSADFTVKLVDISTNFNKKLNDISTNFNKKVNDISTNFNKALNDTSTDINSKLVDISTNFNKSIEDVSVQINDRITTDVSVLRSDMLTKIDELNTSLLTAIDDTSVAINNHVKEEIDKIDATIEAHRARIVSLEKSRDDVDNLLGNILQWENQDGSIL